MSMLTLSFINFLYYDGHTHFVPRRFMSQAHLLVAATQQLFQVLTKSIKVNICCLLVRSLSQHLQNYPNLQGNAGTAFWVCFTHVICPTWIFSPPISKHTFISSQSLPVTMHDLNKYITQVDLLGWTSTNKTSS